VPLFVYGTLRPGGRLHNWIESAVIDSEPATVTGYTLFNLGGHFPLMVPERGRVVHGDILWVDRSNPMLHETVAMELATGYSMDMVEAEAMVPIPVLAFIWQGGVNGLAPVPSNDWNAT
jgi:gamma-glutamylcyclotransferase (GGCT)/AIG2-like uncharacterized protein YtfP